MTSRPRPVDGHGHGRRGTLPGSPGGIVLRVLAFGLVVLAATLTPPAAMPDAVGH